MCSPIDLIAWIIQAWLDAKMHLSNSTCTLRNYSDLIRWFRTWLQERGLDLDSDDTFAVATELECWARRDNPAATTFNHRVTTISSFYRHVRRRRLLEVANPADLVDRVRIQPYAQSRALDGDDLRQKLSAIPRTTLQGKRDYALLTVALQTGRRCAELAQLEMGDLEITSDRITITWRRCKGGKQMRDTLPRAVRGSLLDYLHGLYGPSLEQVPPHAPVWVRVQLVEKTRAPITTSAISHICKRRLGITSVHRLRHTFAKAMEEIGSKLSDIQARLGHNSLATTGIYLAALNRDENPNADALAAFFGFTDDATSEEQPVPAIRHCIECNSPFPFLMREDPRQVYCSVTCSRRAQRRKMEERANALQSVNVSNVGVSHVDGDLTLDQLSLWSEEEQ